MSTGTEATQVDFTRSVKDAHDLIKLHRTSQQGQGRRHYQPAASRGAVVMTVAAWQAFVQDLTKEILLNIEVPAGKPGRGLFKVIKAATMRALVRFNTPNAKNSLSLLAEVGFDPTPDWTFTMGTPPAKYHREDVRSEIDGWLDVRHKIAHGSPLPENRFVSGRTKAGATLHLADAEQCVEFFEKVVAATTASAGSEFP